MCTPLLGFEDEHIPYLAFEDEHISYLAFEANRNINSFDAVPNMKYGPRLSDLTRCLRLEFYASNVSGMCFETNIN